MKNTTSNGGLLGVLMTILMAFPIAGLMALVYRFPIPFAGYTTGLQAAGYAMIAVLFYGFIGGFYILSAIGAVAGAAVVSKTKNSAKLHWKLLLLECTIFDLILLFILAILDKIIGPW